MTKKIIAAAIVAAIAAPAAIAGNTTLYGKVHVSIDKLNSDSSGVDQWEVADRGSRLGVKGSEDLGNGLKAIFKYETTVQVTDGGAKGGTFGSARNAYVGLAGGFGRLLAGRHDTPAKIALYATGTELLGDSIIQLTGKGDAALLNMEETRADNAIAYFTPSFSGVKAAVAVMPGEDAATGEDGLADSWSAGLMYSGNGLKAGFGYEEMSTKWELYNVGASYTMDNFTFGGIYQNQEAVTGGAESEMWALTGKVKFGNNEVIATYADTENNVAGEEGDGFGLAAVHKMSKRTKVYAAYASKDVDAGAGFSSVGGNSFEEGSNFSLGMIHKF